MAEPDAVSPASPPPPVEEPAARSEAMQFMAPSNTADTFANPVLSAPTSAVQQPVPSSATTVNHVSLPIDHATRDPRFQPRSGQAFFSTELGTRAPRSLGQVPMPVIERSRSEPATIAHAATYWLNKFPNQCYCIFPTQGWVVEDLWDVEDLHVENREFCEEMLVFISQNTCRIASQVAEKWVREHPDRADFTGLHMGNVYDVNDPLTIVDQIFIFGEQLSYPRVFLWHVAHMMIVTWIEDSRATWQMQPPFNVGSQHVRQGAELSSTEVNSPDGKKGTKKNRKQSQPRSPKLTALIEPLPAVKNPDRTPIVAPVAPNQADMRSTSQRVSSHGHLQPGTSYIPPRYANMSSMTGSSLLSPSMSVPATDLRRSNRSAASASWVENNSRMYPAPFQRQPAMHPASYMTTPLAVGPMVSGTMAPYVPASQLGVYPQYINQQQDPAMISRGQIGFPPGVMHNPPSGSGIVHHSPGFHNSSMGDMTNMHYPNQMGAPFPDPRAPMLPRPNHPPIPQLYDPYSGNNRKFSGGPAYNNIGKKSGPSNFPTQAGRGRKTSNPAGRAVQHNSNVELHANHSRYPDFNARLRQSEDDPKITSDSIFGCGHTWIGNGNSSVNELWVGDLPLDTQDSEIKQMFEQKLKITPTTVSIRPNGFNKPSSHAFVIFASVSDARTALTINQLNPRLRNGARPTVSVPRRFYQKGVSPSSDLSEPVGSRNTRSVTRFSPTEEKGKQANDDEVAAEGKVSYSPQDVRSGLMKKPVLRSESREPPETTVSPGPDTTKRQQRSPAKNSKAKSKRDVPVKEAVPRKEVEKIGGKFNSGVSSMVATGGADSTRDGQASKESNTAVNELESSAITPTTGSFKEQVAPMTNISPNLDVNQGKAPACDVPSQQPKHEEAPATVHNQENTQVTSDAEFSSNYKKTDTVLSPPRTAGAASSADSGVNSEEQPKDIDSKVTDAADETNSDDEAKNDGSFHSAPEVQPDIGQLDPQSEVWNDSLVANQDTPLLPAAATEINLNKSTTQQSAPATTIVEPTPRGTTTDNSPSTQDPAATTASQTTIDSIMTGEPASTTTKVSSIEASKKSGVSQVQSLHPFAKSKSQTKKEKEAKKKQQKKEADRIAKAKPEKGKQTIVDADTQAKTEIPIDSGMSPVAPDEATEPEAAENGSLKSPTNKKSRGRQKVKAAGATSAALQKKNDGENDTGKLDGDNVTRASPVTRKMDKKTSLHPNQASSAGSGAHGASETTPSPALTAPANAPKAQASAKNAPAKEVTETYQVPPATHEPGSQAFGLNSNENPKNGDSRANSPVSSQYDLNSPINLSRRSSTETLVGDNGRVQPISPANSSHNLSTGAGITEPNTPLAEAPKKKKKPRKKKNKTAAAADLDPAPAIAITELADYIPPPPLDPNSDQQSLFDYDPFISQMTHIDAIRYAVANDTTSYYARTNARMKAKKDAKELEEAKAREEAEERGEGQESSQTETGE